MPKEGSYSFKQIWKITTICDRSKLTKPFATNETEPETHSVMIIDGPDISFLILRPYF
jgi:hypothetical protein